MTVKPTDDSQRPTAGELMSDEELAKPDEGRGGLSPEAARELAREHREAVAEGRARTGEADPNSGQDARGTVDPSGD